MTAQTYSLALPISRYTVELRQEAARIADALRGIPLSDPVPTCPGWTLGDLVSHLRQGYEWATTILTTRSTEFVPPDGLSGAPDEENSWTEQVAGGARGAARKSRVVDPELWAHRLLESADRLVAALDGVELDVPVWAPRGKQNKEFWSRWALFETAVHRGDVFLMAGLPFELDTEVALHLVDAFLSACEDSDARKFLSPLFSEVPRGGQTLCFRSAEEPAGGFSSWLITCAPDGVQVTRNLPTTSVADATVVAAPSDLLLVVKGRLRPENPRMTVLGNRALLDFWLSHAIA
ncbi:maleylpyruvate isomerase N-terminal domain-containing protein [Streptomyces avermitilis]